MAKLNFVIALTDCILEVANSRCEPLSALMSADAQPIAPHAPEHCKRAERLVLLVRALNLLSSGMHLASSNLQSGQLKPSDTVKNGENIFVQQIRVPICECLSCFSSIYDAYAIPFNVVRIEEAEWSWSTPAGRS